MIERNFEYKGLTVTFNTTEDCNLACKYCYEINKKNKKLNFNDAKKFIDLLLSDNDPIGVIGTEDEWLLQNGIVFDFIGGDALIDIGLVEKIVEYFQYRAWDINHKWKNRWRISISTNGTLFEHDGVKDFMEKYGKNLNIGVSIDGCPEIHDKNRVFIDGSGTMKTIIKQWGWYSDWLRRFGMDRTTKSTLNLYSIPYLFESVKFLFEELGITQINMNFIMEDMKPTESDLALLDKELEKVKNYVLEHRNELYLSLFDSKMSTGKPMTESDGCRGRCGSGAMPALGINGKIYPCFRYLPHTAIEERADYNVGDIENGFDKKYRFREVRKATREKISSQKCKECPIESMCAYCIGGCYAEFGEFKRTTYICEIAKIQDKWAKMYWREYDKLEGTHTDDAYYPTFEEYENGKREVLSKL